MASRDLTQLPAYDADARCWRAIIETPRSSAHKYDYEPALDCYVLKRTLPEGMCFPLDFGFFPGTLAEDGDPVDVLVLLDQPAVCGVLVKVRLIGAIQARQKEKAGPWKRNDRLIAVAGHSRALAGVKSLDDMRPSQLDELVEFFVHYNKFEGRKFDALGFGDAKKAEKLLRAGVEKAGKT
jgi:inorganic pyrophosphatase